jgi:hypothetical protein
MPIMIGEHLPPLLVVSAPYVEILSERVLTAGNRAWERQVEVDAVPAARAAGFAF